MEQNEKIQELLKDQEYVKKLISLGSAEKISKELEGKDVDLSPEELRKIYSLAKKKAAGELTDEELENVAGGLGIGAVIGIVSVLSAAGGVTWNLLCS